MKFKHFFMPLGLGISLAWLFLFSGAQQSGVLAAPQATTWYVNAASGDDSNDCLSSGTACAAIGTAVGKSTAGDTIEIAAGIYPEHDLELFHDLTLNGAGAETTLVDAAGLGRAFQVGGEVFITDLSIHNGQTAPSSNIFESGGGAILVGGSARLTLQNVIIADNQAAGSGGGIFNVGHLILAHTQILSNTAEGFGGGIYNYNIGVITTTQGTLLANNEAVGIYGGGLYAGGQAVSLFDTTIRENRAGTFGGGLTIIMDGPAVLERVTLTGNEAQDSAAFFSTQGNITFTNVTVSGNVAANNYGGVRLSGSNAHILLQNSAIAYNSRNNTVGTGYNGLIVGNGATAELSNTLLAYNQDRNCGNTVTSLGYNLSSDFTCGLAQTGDQQGIDPQLVALAENGGFVPTHALMPGSPAIDSGDDSRCPAVDARGIVRPFDGDGNATAICDIGAVEARHQLSIADSTLNEGDSGTVTAVFTVTLAPASSQPITVDYATSDQTAASGSDYIAASDSLTFDPGQTEKYIQVTVNGDLTDELDETFLVSLSNAANADLLDSVALGTIIDDDGLPALAIQDQSILEGNSGSRVIEFEVILSPASPDTVIVQYATSDASASAGSDYTAATDTLTFQPGQTSRTISINVQGDLVDEGNSETFWVDLSSPVNAALADEQAIGTITDDDNARLSHEIGPQVFEGNNGYTPAEFTVSLSTPADFVISVDFAVSSGYGEEGAKAGEDFVPISGTLTFQPGETVQTYNVQIIGDTLGEPDESYSSLISNANVPISVNGSLAKILNDDSYRIYLPLTIH